MCLRSLKWCIPPRSINWMIFEIQNCSVYEMSSENRGLYVDRENSVFCSKINKDSLVKSSTCAYLQFFLFLPRAVLFHMFDKETIGSNNSLGQVNLELKYLDLDEPIRKRYPLADLVSAIFLREFRLALWLSSWKGLFSISGWRISDYLSFISGRKMNLTREQSGLRTQWHKNSERPCMRMRCTGIRCSYVALKPKEER